MNELTIPMHHKIYTLRGKQIMIDSDLAELYEVSTKRLNEQVKRNLERFPDDFMFQLSETEYENLMSQFATSSINKDDSLRSQNATLENSLKRYLVF